MDFHSAWGIIRNTFHEWYEDNALDKAAALAYYTLISLAPLLIVVVAIAGIFYDNSAAVRDALMNQIASLVGDQSASTIQEMMAAAAKPGKSITATIVGIIVLLYGASYVFATLQSMLNTIWEVEAKPGRGILGVIKDRFLSFAMVLGTGFLLLVSLVISTVIAALNQFVAGYLPGGAIFAHALNFTISFGIITLLFAMIYKILPDATIQWKDVWIGAAMTASLFTIGKFLIGLYLGRSSVGSAYGAAGSVVVILIWVYYSALILFMGAEFTQVYARWRGSGIRPKSDVVPQQKNEPTNANV